MPSRASEECSWTIAAATLAIRWRLRQRLWPHGECVGAWSEYPRGFVRWVRERITSAQASYDVDDFTPGVTPQSIRFHRACFEIWQC